MLSVKEKESEKPKENENEDVLYEKQNEKENVLLVTQHVLLFVECERDRE